jgi:hypothetical protein
MSSTAEGSGTLIAFTVAVSVGMRFTIYSRIAGFTESVLVGINMLRTFKCRAATVALSVTVLVKVVLV